jgi:hypothetical protein
MKPMIRDYSGCSAVGSVRRSGRRGRLFESGHPDKIVGRTFLSDFFYNKKSGKNA